MMTYAGAFKVWLYTLPAMVTFLSVTPFTLYMNHGSAALVGAPKSQSVIVTSVIGTTGGVFNAVGNMAGIVTPVVIGYILQTTGSFDGALLFVGAHGLIAVASYWLIVGKIQRFQLQTKA